MFVGCRRYAETNILYFSCVASLDCASQIHCLSCILGSCLVARPAQFFVCTGRTLPRLRGCQTLEGLRSQCHTLAMAPSFILHKKAHR
jgi:hypothetical protein